MSGEKTKVAFVTSHFPFDGKEHFLHSELQALAADFDVMIVPAVSNMRDNWFPELSGRVAPCDAPFSMATLRAAAREFADRPRAALRTLWDVVSAPPGFGARMRNLLIFPKALAVARLLRASGVAHVHAYWLSTPATVAYVVSRLTGIGWSASGHRWDLANGNVRTIGRPCAGFIGSALFIRTISQKGRQMLQGALGARSANRVVAIHIGVLVPPAENPLPARPATGALRLSCVATFTRVKGHVYLLSALKKVKDAGIVFRCVLFGVGPLRQDAARMIGDLGLTDRVEIMPHLPQPEYLAKLHGGEFDAAILTSIDEGILECEGIPVSLMEAMAAGLPCIATSSGSVGELVDDTTGLLVDPKDVDAIAAAVIRLAGDDSLRDTLGDRARTKILEDFSVPKTSGQLAARIRRSLHLRPSAHRERSDSLRDVRDDIRAIV